MSDAVRTALQAMKLGHMTPEMERGLELELEEVSKRYEEEGKKPRHVKIPGLGEVPLVSMDEVNRIVPRQGGMHYEGDRVVHGNPQGNDPVNHPPHYNAHPSGVECIAITEHMNFCLGNAMKYIWRAGLKSNNVIEDLKKARWYVDREIARLEGRK